MPAKTPAATIEGATEADVTTPAPEPTASDIAVEAWVDNHLRNTPLSQNTPAWNHLMSVLPDLKTALNSLS